MERRGTYRVVLLVAAWLTALSVWPAGQLFAETDDLYLIDAHSQATMDTDLATVVPLMDQGGVYRTILSRIPSPPPSIDQMMSIVALAKSYPDRIIPAVSTKVGRVSLYDALLKQQVESRQFRAMAEILIYHAPKKGYPKEVIVPPGDPRVQTAIRYAIGQGWPSVVHIEFGAIPPGRREQFMTEFEAVLKAHPGHPFVLAQMGELPAHEVQRLIEGYANIYFTTAHTTPGTERLGIPVSHLFAGRTLAPDWKRLFVQHPDRFVFSLDVIDPKGWRPQVYLPMVQLWRGAFSDLAPEVAQAVAHGNAERLWKIQPKSQ